MKQIIINIAAGKHRLVVEEMAPRLDQHMRLFLVRHGDSGVLVQIISQHAGSRFLGAGDYKSSLLMVVRILRKITLKSVRQTGFASARQLSPNEVCVGLALGQCYDVAGRFRYFQLRTFPSASQRIVVCKRWDRVSSRFASVNQSTYSFLLV